jgi:hypothetical protein
VVSVGLVQLLTLPVLRLAEGYWPRPFRGLRFRLAGRVSRRLNKKEERWQKLRAKLDKCTAAQQDEYALLDAELAAYPVNPKMLLPTRLGNVLRAAEEYPFLRYGLEITVVWPRLWLVLPDGVRDDAGAARQSLNERIQMMIWSLLFTGWCLRNAWTLPIGLLAALAAYRSAVVAAGVYGELLRAAFDLYRPKVYEALRWELPEAPGTEAASGIALTQYLFRGAASSRTRFTKDASSEKDSSS